jgi:hypothetical protein
VSGKIQIVLIHNNETDRVRYIQPKIELLIKALHNRKFKVQFDEVSDQVLEDISMIDIVKISFVHIYVFTKSTLKRYGFGGNFFLKESFGNARNIFRDFFFKYELTKRRRYIEMVLSRKHEKAIETFLVQNADYLLVFESDAIFEKNSIEILLSLLDDFDTIKAPSYCDLAGGISLNFVLGKKGIASMRLNESKATMYNLNFVNTTCSYLVNRDFGFAIHRFFQDKKVTTAISPDSVFNAFLMEKRINLQVFHFKQPPFTHGSLTGDYPREIP